MSCPFIRSLRHLTTLFILSLGAQSMASATASEGYEYYMQRIPVSERVSKQSEWPDPLIRDRTDRASEW